MRFFLFVFFLFFYFLSIPSVQAESKKINDNSCFSGQIISFNPVFLDNIVSIVIEHDNGVITYGSGSIITNKDSYGHNKILTVKHMFDKNIKNVSIYNRYGQILGNIKEFPVFNSEVNWSISIVKTDSVTLNIIPINNTYDKIEGLKISSHGWKNVQDLDVSSPFGFLKGGSGSPVIDENAEIIGVASSDTYDLNETETDINVINYFHYVNNTNILYNKIKIRKHNIVHIAPIGNSFKLYNESFYTIPSYAAQSCIIYKAK